MNKSTLLQIFLFLVISGKVISQTAQNGKKLYEEGKLYLQLRSASDVTISNVSTIINDPAGSFQTLFMKYHVTATDRPFAFANNAILNKNYKITFIDSARVDSFIVDLAQISSHVIYAEKVPAAYTFSVPNDPLSVSGGTYLPSFYYLPLLNANAASNIHVANGSAIVAIIDDAVLTTHQDLAANIGTLNIDLVDNDNNPNPALTSGSAAYVSHGTRVAGIAGAVTNNSIGIASIGWNNKLMCVKVSSDNAPSLGALSNPYAGILWAAQNGAQVINVSWGNFAASSTEYQVITTAKGYNVVLVAAAGNDMANEPTYPAAYGELQSGLSGEVYDRNLVVAVAALDQNSNVGVWTTNTGGSVNTCGSNYGSWVDISAYGSAIPSTTAASTSTGAAINNQYGSGNGTSFAAPMISGIAGVMRSYNPSKSADQIIDCLINTANPDIYGSSHPSNQPGALGSGRADAGAALRCISSACSVNPIVIIVPSSTGLCSGVTFTLSANQGANSYSWSTGASGTSITVNAAGIYSVIASYTSGGGCTATGTISVAPPPTLTLAVNSNTTLCPGGYVSVISAAGSFNSLIWQPGGLTTNSIIANFPSATVFSATANQCVGATATISVAGATATPNFGVSAAYSILGPTLSSTYASILNTNGHYVILTDAIVNGFTSFNYGEIIVGPNVKITVPSSSTLNINSSYLHSCGTDLWKGIVVENSGALTMYQINNLPNSPLIEDAITAISSTFNSTLSAVPAIKLSRAVFNKNYIDISLSGFNDANLAYANILNIDNCVFTCRDIISFLNYNSPIIPQLLPSSAALRTGGLASYNLLPPYLQAYSAINIKSPYSTQSSHIAVNLGTVGITTGPLAVTNGTGTMPGISIGNSTVGDFNLFDSHGSFIVANKSNVILKNNTFQNTQTYTVSGGATFGGSAIKHSAGYSSSNAMHTMLNMSTGTVSGIGNRFWDCHTGIELHNTYLFLLENSTFVSSQTTASLTGYLPGNTGILAATNNFDYYIANNEFTNLKTAINIPIAVGSVAPANTWSSSAAVIGIFAHRIRITNNLFSVGSGTNTYMNRAVDLTCPNSVPWQSSILVVPGASVTPFPQAFSVGNNTITDVYNGISVNGSHGFQVDVSGNSISLKNNSTPQFAIQLLNCNPTTSASIGKNLVTTNTASFSAASATTNAQSALIFCGNNGYGVFSPSVSCNVLKQGYAGFVFENANQQAVWSANDMQLPMQRGMILQNSGVIGVQGGSTTAIANTWSGGTWSGANNYHTYTSGSQASLSVLWVRNVTGLQPSNSAGIPNPQSYASTGNYTYVSSGSGDYNCSDFSNNKVFQIPLSGHFSLADLYYMSKTDLYRFLAANDSVLSSGNPSVTVFYAGLTGSSIEKFTQIEKYLYQGMFSTAVSLNADITATNTIETNYKNYYSLYATYAANDFQHTNSTDEGNLYTLATLCPGTNGACIYQAGSLYNRVYKNIPVPSCLPIGARIVNPETTNQIQLTDSKWDVSLYPNPAKDQLTLVSNRIESELLTITITDLSGRKISSFTLHTNDFMSKLGMDLSNGAYLIKITNSINETLIKKLLISK